MALLLAGCVGCGLLQTSTADETVFSFVFMGCNRVDENDVNRKNPSTANLAQLNRTFSEIAAMNPPPAIVFFTGDLVVGLNRDLKVLRNELEAWVSVYRASDLAKRPLIRLVALMGNHESLKVGKKGQTKEVSNPGAEAVWLSVMGDFIAGDNGPKAGGPDKLKTDQSRLTYSFNFRDTHFVVLNTDPDGAPATVPVHWIQSDLEAAKSDPSIRHIFALGHKPAFTPPGTEENFSLDFYPTTRDMFWESMTNVGAIYLPAHTHMYERHLWCSRKQHTACWQIVSANAGSPLDPGWKDPTFYGYAVISITRLGRVIVTAYGRDFDHSDYLAPSPPDRFPTTIRDRADISQPLAPSPCDNNNAR